MFKAKGACLGIMAGNAGDRADLVRYWDPGFEERLPAEEAHLLTV